MADEAEAVVEEPEVDEEKDIEDEVKELQDSLTKLKKESAGKDAKISKLLKDMEKREEQGKRRKKTEAKNYGEMEPDQLQREIERIQEEAEERAEKEIEKERSKVANQNFKLNIIDNITKLDGLDPSLASQMVKLMTTDKNADEDELLGTMQSFTNTVNEFLKKHRVVYGNRERVAHRPSSGDVDTSVVPSERTWAKWTEEQRKAWSGSASREQLEKIQFRT